MAGLESRNDLLSIIQLQKKELEKYKSKLTDLVVAFRGVVKEKEALEATVKALTKSEDSVKIENASVTAQEPSTSAEQSVEHLEKQLATLMNSLSTLSAEKSRLEALYQTEKKKLRAEKEQAENKCLKLEEKWRNFTAEIEDLKCKLTVEKHERDKERNNSHLMIMELQQLLDKERTSKLIKDQLSEDVKSTNSNTVNNFQEEIKILTNKLMSTVKQLEQSERKVNESLMLQEEIKQIKIEHQSELKQERERAIMLEKESQALSILQEKRVVNLEERLAELSDTVGMYERLRQQDQTAIQKLKEQVAQFTNTPITSVEKEQDNQVDEIIKQFVDLRQKLLLINETSNIDLSSILNVNSVKELDHTSCKEDYNKLKKEYDVYRQQVPLTNNFALSVKQVKEMESLRNQVKHLQERVKMTSDNLQASESKYEREIDHFKKQLKTEKERFKETISACESDFRGRLSLLEQQLQKQRERSLALLEEKEQEIHSLQGTFQMFLPTCRSGERSYDELQEENNTILRNLQSNSTREGPIILHYANELARRDVEIANLRKSKHLVDSTLRDLQKAAVHDNEKHLQERQTLREEIARLQRCKSREGANLEYLKNVVYNFLITSDASSKRHMLNAIGAVLKFSDDEIECVTKHRDNKWWGLNNVKT